MHRFFIVLLMLLLTSPTIATAVTSQVVGILDADTIDGHYFY